MSIPLPALSTSSVMYSVSLFFGSKSEQPERANPAKVANMLIFFI